ncbi:SEC-C metal-binding domain-containing protein [Cobetia sp. 1AS1]|uniref:SEC-C metal-binding domain-containing protein n=1 Tax=Cobetia sp. 1AS1 TaxID=3040016 RepID=UPI002449A156|nr:SEC-C metal-binding domain-containing protein [Cobetia sp. 1AS1]MDH2293654.1 SEC-C metal-binding domain-containing protein [Cobetia sp. 1AS1]
MNDIELANNVSPSIGDLYKTAKEFSSTAPALSITYLRSLASVFCDALDNDLAKLNLSSKIHYLKENRMLSHSLTQHLKTLQRNGNKAAHPEDYLPKEKKPDFSTLTVESLGSARSLIEHLYSLKHSINPVYVIEESKTNAFEEMCKGAMIDRNEEMIYKAGVYFKEKAIKLTEEDNIFLEDGYGWSAQKDIEQAVFLFKQGAEAGQVNCMYEYGVYIANHKDNEKKFIGKNYILRAATEDHPEAILYCASSAITNNDPHYARELLQRGADLQQPKAMSMLGEMYATGTGGEKDSELAATLTLGAAKHGYPRAQYNLFILYREGSGLEQNDTKALKWLKEAVEQNYPDAEYSFAECISNGLVENHTIEYAVSLYINLLDYDDFICRSSLALAKIIQYKRNITTEDLMEAANYLQLCYEHIKSDDDTQMLKRSCLDTSKVIVSTLRERLSKNGPDEKLQFADIIASCLFNKSFTPCKNKQARIMEIAHIIQMQSLSPDEISEKLLREACIKQAPPRQKNNLSIMKQNTLNLANSSKKVGRNEACPCGSGNKYKRCHGN